MRLAEIGQQEGPVDAACHLGVRERLLHGGHALWHAARPRTRVPKLRGSDAPPSGSARYFAHAPFELSCSNSSAVTASPASLPGSSTATMGTLFGGPSWAAMKSLKILRISSAMLSPWSSA